MSGVHSLLKKSLGPLSLSADRVGSLENDVMMQRRAEYISEEKNTAQKHCAFLKKIQLNLK